MFNRWLACTCLCLTTLLALPLVASELRRGEPQVVESARGVVVSETDEASSIGAAVLERGGTAADAAVAVAMALTVTWPEAGNIAGGGFMIVATPDGEVECVEYRERAPLAATRQMYDEDSTRYDHLAVGVPGTLRGLELAHRRHGNLPWRELVMPAARLAEEGFVVDEHLARSLNRILSRAMVQREPRFAELRRVFGKPGGGEWAAGDRLIQPDLARTLRQIAEGGADAFYRGAVGEALIAEMQRGNGIISADDLEAYEAVVRPTVRTEFRGYEVHGAPLPSSGGTCIALALNILETFDLREHEPYSARNVHLIAEAMRRAFADRARHLGDSDFVEIPAHLTDKAYARKLAEGIDPNRATPSAELTPDIPLADAPDRPDTTHFSIVDADGMAVSNTYTLEASWGSRIVVRGAGFLLNNEMGDFNWLPGVTETTGRIGTEPNTIEPGKRMLSSQCPVIVLRDGRAVLVTGSPGGRTIINTVLTILLHTLEFDRPLPDAVAAPRLHHQWFPDRLRWEAADEPAARDTVAALRDMGHRVEAVSSQGSAHSIWLDHDRGVYRGVADFRRGGAAVAPGAAPEPAGVSVPAAP